MVVQYRCIELTTLQSDAKICWKLRYWPMLRKVCILEPNYSFMLVKDWFQHNNVALLNWPSQFHDLNINEKLWGELKQKMGKEVFINKNRF